MDVRRLEEVVALRKRRVREDACLRDAGDRAQVLDVRGDEELGVVQVHGVRRIDEKVQPNSRAELRYRARKRCRVLVPAQSRAQYEVLRRRPGRLRVYANLVAAQS